MNFISSTKPYYPTIPYISSQFRLLMSHNPKERLITMVKSGRKRRQTQLVSYQTSLAENSPSGVAMATLKHFVISSLRAVDDTHLVPSPTFSPAPFFLLLAFALFSISIQLALIKKAEFRYMIWGKRRDSEDSDMPPSPHHDHLICRSFSRRLGTGAPPSPDRQHTTQGTHWTSGITHKTQDNTLHN